MFGGKDECSLKIVVTKTSHNEWARVKWVWRHCVHRTSHLAQGDLCFTVKKIVAKLQILITGGDRSHVEGNT